jgi:hypothetical protein
LNVASGVENAVDQYTDIDSDSITVQCSAMVIGHLVANQTDKITNPMVEKTAAKLSVMKTNWKNRKQS